ncbi:MAG: hypothetical protein ACYS83_05980 [Planctomycetota bacterium]|jgi:hypothetical protein
MSETDNNKRLPKRSVFDLTTVSLGLALGGLFMSGLFGDMVTAEPAAGIGLAFGLLGVYQTKKGGRKLHKAIAAVVVNCLLLLLALASARDHRRSYELAQRLVCASNLTAQGKTMTAFANKYDNRYPAMAKWCDLLLRYNEPEEKDRVDKRWFICKGAVRAGDKGPCHYAINPNCKPNSPIWCCCLKPKAAGTSSAGRR